MAYLFSKHFHLLFAFFFIEELSMANDIKYDRILLSIATGQICQSLGWHGIHKTPHNILTDVLERYINDLARTVIGCSLNGKLFVLFEPRFRRCRMG